MEDGDNSYMEVSSMLNATDNKVEELPNMANYPDIEVTVIKNKTTDSATKVNGESDKKDAGDNEEEDEDSSDEDALVIDEERKSQKKVKTNVSRKRLLSPSCRTDFKGFKKRILLKSNDVLKVVKDYMNAAQLDEHNKINEEKCDNVEDSNSQGELDSIVLQEAITKNINDDTENPEKEDSHSDTPTCIDHKSNLTKKPVEVIGENTQAQPQSPGPKHRNVILTKLKSTGRKSNKKTPSPKLTEYAQYLGLQPTVKFKCCKCSESSFPSLSALNEHQRQCLAQPPISKLHPPPPSPPPATNTPSTNFRVTRKVYLCSACGTYYENWNLFLHMREVHRRFICLYCLGMFSFVEKLSQHLTSKHNCLPTHYLSADDYLSTNTAASFLMCCHCDRVFTEQENFFGHVCTEKTTPSVDKLGWSCGVKDSHAHLPICKANIEQPSTSTQKTQSTTKTLSTKTVSQKQNKTTKNNPKLSFANIEHVTADSPTKPVSPKPDQTCDLAKFCMVDMEQEMKLTETKSPENTTTTSENTHSPSHSNQDEQREEPEAALMDEVDTASNDKSTEVEKDEELIEEEPTENDNNKMDCDKTESDQEDQNQNECNTSDEPTKDLSNDLQNANDGESEKEDIDSDTNVDKDTNEETNDLDSSRENEIDDEHSDEIEEEIHNEIDEEKNEISEPELEAENKENKPQEELRRVPKVTLKLPPKGMTYSDNESDDSEKLTMEVEENEESEGEYDESQENSTKELNDLDKQVNGFDDSGKESLERSEMDCYPIAGDDVSIVELELEHPIDKFTPENLLRTCLGATILTCIYCNHARKIAVNGKQLGLHAIAEHRFAATVDSITAEELIPENFVTRIKGGLQELEDTFFSLEQKIKEELKEDDQPIELNFKREYECFQCRYVTAIHKELYLHNRKMHAKTILLCIICKSNFYSYSELICHLCPGNYALNNDMKFRCCMCEVRDLPSAFRLMVHLRKRHHTCDVCLEGCFNQSKLSNHVWKHKLHHLCYRCGIAYRNKPDITKHLFWKHGTESVLCKKCLQKKWPHVYHFCIPPVSFVCEECNLSFSKAVFLKVHKRLHSNERIHSCTEENCKESFISKKLLLKHERWHREPELFEEKPIAVVNGDLASEKDQINTESLGKETIESENKNEASELKTLTPEKDEPKTKSLIDVYDLPALNLSESDSDDSEEEAPKPAPALAVIPEEPSKNEDEPIALQTGEPIAATSEEEQKPVPILDGIWENFKQYQATIEKREGVHVESKDDVMELENKDPQKVEHIDKPEEKIEDPIEELCSPDINVIMADHDYCSTQNSPNIKGNIPEENLNNDESSKMDHDYCTLSRTGVDSAKLQNTNEGRLPMPEHIDKKKNKSLKKKTSSSSDSSSDSDSSSCTCGSNCSCSSSTGSSSSSSSSSDSDSSSSEGKRRIAARREKRKERAKRKKESETSHAASNNSAVDAGTEDHVVPVPKIELPIEESDLDTDETETDEDFYDEHPQRLANKILAEKRNQLMLLAAVAPVSNGSIVECSRPSTPSIPEEVPPKKKVKSKKRKKKSRSSTPKHEVQQHNIPSFHNHQQSPLSIQSPVSILPSIVHRPSIPSPIHHLPVSGPVSRHIAETTMRPPQTTGSGSETDSNVRSSKRRRVPNKFYGYSSDDENADRPPAPPILKWRKADLPSTPTIHHVTASPKFVPPITIKNVPSPAPILEPVHAPIVHHTETVDSDSETDEVQHRKSSSDSSDSNHNDDSDSDGGQLHISQPPVFPPPTMPQTQRTNENLYCYCQCPYDEVSEMIACDGRECAIEWFHFECVGIMVPPKGKWYCPDCRKKVTIRNDFIH